MLTEGRDLSNQRPLKGPSGQHLHILSYQEALYMFPTVKAERVGCYSPHENMNNMKKEKNTFFGHTRFARIFWIRM